MIVLKKGILTDFYILMKAFNIGLFFIFFCFLYANAQKVEKVTVKGNQRIETDTILANLPFKEGSDLDEEALNINIKALYKTKFFSDVKLSINEGIMLVEVTENPLINDVTFKGLKKFDKSELVKEIKTKENTFYSTQNVISDLKIIKALYEKSGIFEIKINPQIEIIEGNKVNINFDIKEGKKIKISKIFFLGNKVYNNSKLTEVLGIAEDKPWRFLSSRSVYDEERVQFEQDNLRSFYMKRGYADFVVNNIVSEFDNINNTFTVNFNLTEGEKYTIQNVQVNNMIPNIDEKKLKIEKNIDIKSGEVFNIEKIEKAKQNIIKILNKLGFTSVDVVYDFQKTPAEKKLDIIFTINQTPRIYIGKITILGNKKTDDKVIRREINLQEGDVLDTGKLAISIQKLRQLGYFRDVKTEEQRIEGKNNEVELKITVVEDNMATANAQIAFASGNNLIGILGVNHSNFLGKGYQTDAQYQRGTFNNSWGLGFRNPYFLDKRFSLGFNVGQSTITNPFFGQYKQKSNNLTLNSGYNIADFVYHNINYSHRTDNLTVLEPTTASPLLKLQEGNYETFLLSHTVSYDKRDDRIMPTSGYAFSFSQGIAGIGRLGNVSYLSHEVNAFYHIQTIKNLDSNFILSLGLKAGTIRGTQGHQVYAKDRFMFGLNEMRGFEINGVGPRIAYLDRQGNITGYDSQFGSVKGNNYFYLTAEHTFPNFIPKEMGFVTAMFFDAGSLWGVDGETNLIDPSTLTYQKIVSSKKIRTSAGISVTWRSPMGLIGFNIGRAISKEPYDNTRFFRLNLGVSNFNF